MEPAIATIHRKDCIGGLRELSPEVVDLAFADPPFNIGYDYDIYQDKRDRETYLEWTRQWMRAVCRVLKSSGTFWIAIGDEYAAEIKTIAQKDLGLSCRSWIVWYYTFGVNCTRKFNRSHAHLFHLVKDPKKFTFNNKEIRVPSARQLVYSDGRARPEGRLPDDTWILRPQDVHSGFGADQDTWYFPRVAGTFKERAGFHGCQMPEQLLGRIIRCCSNPDELVLDPFAGSGTTLAVANKLGRRWIGFEISASYAQKALDRVSKTHKGQPLEGSPEPLVSAPRTPRNGKKHRLKADRESVQEDLANPSFATGEDAPSRRDLERAIIAAFLVTNRGFSADRIIADPEMNSAFLDQCKQYGIPGDPVVWNRTLMRVRKAAKLASLPPSRKTTFPRDELDAYMFASEIAIRRMLDSGSPSLDDIFCDPEQAERFDQIARSFSPGFSPLQYRWAALRIRKRAHDSRKNSESLRANIRQQRPLTFEPIGELRLDQIDFKPGVYLVRDNTDRHLYAGETFDLGSRIRRKLHTFDPWQEISKGILIGVLPLADAMPSQRRVLQTNLRGRQSNLIEKHQPDLNYLALGVA